MTAVTVSDKVMADEPDQHELVWTSYPELNTERNKQGVGSGIWGGGSFFKLISRLAIDGCDVNAFIAVTPEGQRLSHHFQAPGFINRSFGEGNYLREVPAGSRVGFSCVDSCDIYIGPGAGTATRETCMSADDYIEYANVNSYFDFQTACTWDFSAEVSRGFFDHVALFQDVCIAYFRRATSSTKAFGVAYGPMSNYRRSYTYMRHQPFVIVYNDKSEKDLADGAYSDYYLSYVKTILHEVCHQRQKWYFN